MIYFAYFLRSFFFSFELCGYNQIWFIGLIQIFCFVAASTTASAPGGFNRFTNSGTPTTSAASATDGANAVKPSSALVPTNSHPAKTKEGLHWRSLVVIIGVS